MKSSWRGFGGALGRPWREAPLAIENNSTEAAWGQSGRNWPAGLAKDFPEAFGLWAAMGLRRKAKAPSGGRELFGSRLKGFRAASRPRFFRAVKISRGRRDLERGGGISKAPGRFRGARGRNGSRWPGRFRGWAVEGRKRIESGRRRRFGKGMADGRKRLEPRRRRRFARALEGVFELEEKISG
jgi:hypothetical protein